MQPHARQQRPRDNSDFDVSRHSEFEEAMDVKSDANQSLLAKLKVSIRSRVRYRAGTDPLFKGAEGRKAPPSLALIAYCIEGKHKHAATRPGHRRGGGLTCSRCLPAGTRVGERPDGRKPEDGAPQRCIWERRWGGCG